MLPNRGLSLPELVVRCGDETAAGLQHHSAALRDAYHRVAEESVRGLEERLLRACAPVSIDDLHQCVVGGRAIQTRVLPVVGVRRKVTADLAGIAQQPGESLHLRRRNCLAVALLAFYGLVAEDEHMLYSRIGLRQKELLLEPL